MGNCIIYDAFSMTSMMTGGEALTFERHLTAIESNVSLSTSLIDSMWQDVFVCPTTEEIRDMRLYEIYDLVRYVLIPHIYSVTGSVVSPSRRFWNLLHSKIGEFEAAYTNSGRFFEAIQILANAPGGKKIANDLANEKVKNEFRRLLPPTFLREDDYLTYRRDPGGDKGPVEQNLILPSWVRNRLAHPENRYESAYPSHYDIQRATALVYAVSLALRMKRTECLGAYDVNC